MSRIRVLVVDDQPLFREGLATLLSTVEDFEVAGIAADGAQAVSLAVSCLPDVILMDLRMPVQDGVAATRRVRIEAPSCQVVVLTTFEDDQSIVEALRAGAIGYLLKDAPLSELSTAVRKAASGESILATRVATRLVQHVARSPAPPGGPTDVQASTVLSQLTSREREVLTLLGRGASNKDVARALDVAEGTVKNHLSSIFGKLGVNDRLGAALLARELGLS